MRNIIIDGRLGKDAEIKSTKDGKQYLSMAVANDIYANGEVKTEWFNVSSFIDSDLKRAQYLTSGRFVIISGDLTIEPRTSNGKLYLNMYIRAHNIDMPRLGQRQNSNTTSQPAVSAMPQAPSAIPQPPSAMPQAPVYATMPAQPQAYQQVPQPVAYPQPAPAAPQGYAPRPVAPQPVPVAPQPLPNNTYTPPAGAPSADNGDDLPF